MANRIKARLCSFPVSSWVHAVYLTCDNQLALQFKQGVHHHYRPKGRSSAFGGGPGVTCLYPKVTGDRFFELMLVWPSQGRFVWRVLPYHQPYQIVGPPQLPCAGCATSVTVASSKNPSNSGDSVTFTATVTNSDGTAAPQGGLVEFFDGSTDLGAGSALSPSGDSASSTFTTSSLSAGTHTIKATFTAGSGYQPSSGFQTSTGQVTQTVNSGGVTVACCGNSLSSTLHATITSPGGGCPCAPTTVTLSWDGTSKWTGTGAFGSCGRNISVSFYCAGTNVSGFRLDFTMSDSCASGTGITPGGTPSCSPLSVLFSTSLNGVCGCPAGGGVQITVTT